MAWTCEGRAGDHMHKDMVGVNFHVRRHHQFILENVQADRTNEVALDDLSCSNFGKDKHFNNVFNE